MSSLDAVLPDGYARFLSDLKDRVRSARVQAQRVVNASLIDLYWSIGDRILTEQERQGWGSAVITRLADDLRREFPEMTGLSRSNLQYMRAFASAWPVWDPNVPQAVGHLPWGHIRVLLDKKLPHDRGWAFLLSQYFSACSSRTASLPRALARVSRVTGVCPLGFEGYI